MDDPGSGENAQDKGLPDAAYRRFFLQSAVPTMTIDLNARRITDVNPASAAFLGLPRDQIIGKSGADFLAEPTPDEVLRARALRGDSTRVIRYVRTSRGLRTAEIIMDPAGPEGVTFVQAIDLTDLLDANGMLETRTAELEAKSRTLQTVASRIAHDLRGPLSAITGFADILAEGWDELEADERSMMFGRIRTNITTLAEMITTVLGDRHDAATDEDAEALRGSVAELFARLRAMFEVQLTTAGATLSTVSTVARLPVPVSAVQQSVVNLVGNSLKFGAADRPLRIVVAVTAEADRTLIDVTDNGIGVEGDLDALFSAGGRGANVGAVEGSGLGLAFAAQAVRDLGGDITVHHEDEGATFRIALPTSIERADQSDPVGGSVATGMTAAQLEQMLDGWPTPVIIIDLGRRKILRVNPAAATFFGRKPTELFGQSSQVLFVDPADADALRTRAISAATAGRHEQRATLRGLAGPVEADVVLTSMQDSTLAALVIVPR